MMTQDAVLKIVEEALTSHQFLKIGNMGLVKLINPTKFVTTIKETEIEFRDGEDHLTFTFDEDFTIEVVGDIKIIN